MKSYVGIWVDHAGAVFVFLRDGEPRVERIDSNVDPHFRLRGGFRSRGLPAGQEIVAENRVEARREGQLRRYYREIIRRIRDQDGILVLGPGEAKLHLATTIREENLGSRLRATRPADKMTERQLVARVREFFDPGTGRRA